MDNGRIGVPLCGNGRSAIYRTGGVNKCDALYDVLVKTRTLEGGYEWIRHQSGLIGKTDKPLSLKIFTPFEPPPSIPEDAVSIWDMYDERGRIL